MLTHPFQFFHSFGDLGIGHSIQWMCFGPVKDSRLTVPAHSTGLTKVENALGFFFKGFCDVTKVATIQKLI
jgi:hypothetical protein